VWSWVDWPCCRLCGTGSAVRWSDCSLRRRCGCISPVGPIIVVNAARMQACVAACCRWLGQYATASLGSHANPDLHKWGSSGARQVQEIQMALITSAARVHSKTSRILCSGTPQCCLWLLTAVVHWHYCWLPHWDC
jgi:hypothetical protein